MSNAEKVLLISQIISDFWEFSEPEQIERGAQGVVTAIFSIVDFEVKSKED